MQPHIDVYFWCAFQVFVFFKLASNVFIQGRSRKVASIVTYPEDRKTSSARPILDAANSNDERVIRATNLFRNDLENIVPFSLIAFAAALVQVDARIYLLILCVYALARISHAACLIGAIQPFRSLSYLVGQLCALVFVVLIVVRLIPIFQSY